MVWLFKNACVNFDGNNFRKVWHKVLIVNHGCGDSNKNINDVKNGLIII